MSHSSTHKAAYLGGFVSARSTRLELATSRVHVIPYFRRRMDYIFTIDK